MGDACRLDLAVQVDAWPNMSWQEYCKTYHDKANKTFRGAVAGARLVKQAKMQGKPVPDILPASFVKNIQQQSYVMYWEAGFCSATEMEKLCGCSAQMLRIGKPTTLVLEDGVTTLRGWLVSLKGLSETELAGMRRLRAERRVGVEWCEHLMEPKQQLRTGQQADVFKWVSEKRTEHAAGNIMQPTTRSHLYSIDKLREKAQLAAEAAFLGMRGVQASA